MNGDKIRNDGMAHKTMIKNKNLDRGTQLE